MLYNENLKNRYIEERNKEIIMSKNFLLIQFKKVAPIENELNKDVSNFTVYEILDFYKTLNSTSYNFLAVINSVFSLYTQWCIQQNLVLDNQNHFLELTKNHFMSCTNKGLAKMKIVSREDVLKWTVELVNPRDQFIVLGLFEGIKGKDFCELIKLRPEDIKENIATLCTGREVVISKELMNIIEKCIEEKRYYSVSNKQQKIVNLLDRGYIIKDYPNSADDTSDYQKGRKLYNGLSRALKSIDLDYINAGDIYDSGRIHMIKTKAKERNMSVKDYVYSNNISEIEKQYDTRFVRSMFWTKYKDYLV